LIVDPGPPNPEYQQSIASSLTRSGGRPLAILLTHGHPDHAPGAAILKDLVNAEVIGSRQMAPEDAAAAQVDRFLAEDETFDLGSDELRVLAAPGHAPDQVALWMPGSRFLFTGDTILGTGSTLIAPPEGDMVAYMETLERLRALDPRLILPGHGPVVTEPLAKIDEYIAHRRDRERQLLEAVADRPATIEDLVARIYADVDPRLHDLARGSVEAQLIKLERERRIARAGDVYTARPDASD
jgi:hydroxyacylglutathione hydrolase